VRRAIPSLLGSAAALAFASPAVAADVQVTGLDRQAFEPATIAVAVGDTVHWTFEAGLPHNAFATSANWAGAFNAAATAPAPPAQFKFSAPGVYEYHCTVHSTVMTGTVIVGNPPPPPPPPLSEQPFPNDGAITPAQLEVGGLDTARPALRGVAAKPSGRRVRVSFRVSERSVVTVRLSRAGRTVRTRRAASASRGSVTVRGLRAGRYRVQLRARDLAGNASAARIAHVTVG
jgi:plastocyanin